jgi:hypothetical protein
MVVRRRLFLLLLGGRREGGVKRTHLLAELGDLLVERAGGWRR